MERSEEEILEEISKSKIDMQCLYKDITLYSTCSVVFKALKLCCHILNFASEFLAVFGVMKKKNVGYKLFSPNITETVPRCLRCISQYVPDYNFFFVS